MTWLCGRCLALSAVAKFRYARSTDQSDDVARLGANPARHHGVARSDASSQYAFLANCSFTKYLSLADVHRLPAALYTHLHNAPFATSSLGRKSTFM